ncbi:MAG: prolipoprotein diacylglyceryl transferase [Actinomycetota bacterium]|nr:prolipoprotein diacylglyceryl transferase [Actinomycetota bacterium]
MHRILFQIGDVTVYSYGVFLAVGFIVALGVARYRLSEHYRNPDTALDMVLGAVIGGILGARLFYVVGHFSYFKSSPGEIFKLNMEGLVFYGGLILGLLLSLLIGKWRKLRLMEILDLAGLCVPLGLAIGRIGCFMNGCCYGKTTSMPWGVTYPSELGIIGARHPTQIYELVLDLLLFAILFWKRDSFKREGTLFFLFLCGYGAIRFTLEFFREHQNPSANLFFQVFSLIILVASLAILVFSPRILVGESRREY